MTELKPCPFCGERPDDYIRSYMKNSSSLFIEMYIICRNCEVARNTIRKSIEIPSGSPYERLIEAHNKLIEDWNTRKGE